MLLPSEVGRPGLPGPYYLGRKTRYLPRIWERATALPDDWYHLLIDSKTWRQNLDPNYEGWLRGFDATAPEIHRRLAHRSADRAAAQSMLLFPDPVDPEMGEIRSLQTRSRDLANAIEASQKPR